MTILQRLQMLNNYYKVTERWGVMDSKVFTSFVNWLQKHEIVPNTLDADQLYTNELLKI